jgi:DNA (cytosine-5)-methyltransferase 1
MLKEEGYKVVDLFAGPGGLGEGFSALGFDTGKSPFKLAVSIEKDPSAHSTLLLRSFYRQFTQDNTPQKYREYVRGDITKTELFDSFPNEAKAAAEEAQCLELGKTPQNEVKRLIHRRLNGCEKWVLVGGPPCQAYSLVGRSRMRNTVPDFESDERHFLYKEYLRIIADHRPPVFVMENVKGMLSAQHSGKKIIWSILSDLRKPSKAVYGNRSGPTYKLFSLVNSTTNESCEPEDFLVRAEKYGIPQARHRVLILGIREGIDITPKTLIPSGPINIAQAIGDLPKIRSCVSKEEDSLEFWRNLLDSVTKEHWYVNGKTESLISVVEKIDAALKKIKKCNLGKGAETLAYNSKPAVYAEWFRRGCDGIITNHTGRSHMRSDLHRYFFASSFASVYGRSVHIGELPKELLPAHKNVQNETKNDAFSDRFRVQVGDRPATTITSHISKDGHYFIHYDPAQCRSLTVREAARLQTFPDNYKFEGNKTSQYHQVGNAVPPLLSMQIAEIVKDILKRLKP